MMGVLRVFLTVLLLSGPVSAQVVEIRAGEHETFTRLVVLLPEREPFALQREGREVMVAFENRKLEFTSRSVFERVPRTRLSNVTIPADAGQIALSLNCDCRVDSFWHDGRALVLDIRDETIEQAETPQENDVPTATEKPEQSVDAVPVPADRHPSNATFDAAQTDTAASDLDVNQPMEDVEWWKAPRPGTSAFLLSDAQLRQLSKPAAEDEPEAVSMSDADRIDASRTALIREVGRAASLGLLSPRVTLPSDAEPSVRPSDTDTSPAQEVPAKPIASETYTDPMRNLSLKAETSMNRDLAAVTDPRLDAIAGTGCPADIPTHVLSWAGEGAFVDQIGPLRSALIGEFDQPSARAVQDLVRFYIHYGFGAEARQILQQLDVEASDAPILMAMADIVENGHEQGSVLAGFLDCEPDLAVWSALSYQDLPSNVPLDPDAILRGFSALPVHLRGYLGPFLGMRLHKAGYEWEANHIRRTLARFDATKTPASQFLTAQIEEPAEAEKTLQSVIASNSEPSAEALMSFINRRLSLKQDVPYDLAQLAGAYAMEYRGQPLGGELSRTYLRALAASGAFEQAFSELSLVSDAEIPAIESARSELYEILTRSASDQDFLYHAASLTSDEQARLSDAAQNMIAERLVALGFVLRAESFISARAGSGYERSRKVLRAKIALHRDLPRNAELALLGLEGPDIDLLNARAQSLTGAHESARMSFEAGGAAEDAMREAWLNMDWPRLKDHADPAISNLAGLIFSEVTPAEAADDAAILQQNRNRVESSMSMRAAVETLLRETPTGSNEPQ